MATNIKVLGSVSITSTSASSPTVIYAPSGTKSALVTSIALYNTGGGTSDVFLGVRNSVITVPPVIHKQTGMAAGAAVVLPDIISLSAASSENFVGYLAAAGSVNCLVYGIERD